MLTNIVSRWADIQRLKAGEMIYPSFVDFHGTNVCNQHCTGCAYDSLLETQIMPEARQFQAIDTFLEVGVKAFDFAGGGEPTLAPYLARAMQYIADRGAHFALITNGVKLSDDLIDVLVKHGTYLRVSLEASDSDSYRAYKKCPEWHWDRVLDNIGEVIRRRNAAGSQLEVSLKFLVGKPDGLRGAAHYDGILSLAEWLKPDRITIKALRHEPDELPESVRRFEQLTCDTIIGQSALKIPVHAKIAPKYNALTHPQCWLTPVHSMVEWNGDMFLCCYHYYRKDEMLIGNIFERPFKEIWLSQRHKDQIAGIDKKKCAAVDCKFGAHHEAVAQMERQGAGYWI